MMTITKIRFFLATDSHKHGKISVWELQREYLSQMFIFMKMTLYVIRPVWRTMTRYIPGIGI